MKVAISSGLLPWLALAGLLASCQQEERQAVEITAPAGSNRIKALVGRPGGILRFPGGGASLQIPAKLLQEDVTVVFQRREASLDLPGKDVVGRAYGISPRLNFAPGAVRLSIPVDRTLPGPARAINLRLYYYGKKVSEGPQGRTQVDTWQQYHFAEFAGRSSNGHFLEFDVFRTPATGGKPPFGMLQAAFDVK